MRSLLWSAVALAAGLVLTPLPPAAADDDTGGVSCLSGTLQLRYTPGLTFTEKTIRVRGTGDLSSCQSAKHPGITRGVVRVRATVTGRCPGPIDPASAKVTITWNDGSRSTITESAFSRVGKALHVEGDVAAGAFKGGVAHADGRATGNLIAAAAACLTGGFTRSSIVVERFSVDA
ncbi:hypothetical protein [Herbidospora sp. NBRC 101105]|uniref:hypothetical protein n=1 Tax=Herbidospora sp. NBRC 101105 TaxID=3032195 RepID=UPI0024A58695|nr:hypothetical protein [Herbidospora sp. NBRC 101105]GLX97711.1 hypothetical protein Hesp01_56610 [Herbidospora sp. NBRC 101105]